METPESRDADVAAFEPAELPGPFDTAAVSGTPELPGDAPGPAGSGAGDAPQAGGGRGGGGGVLRGPYRALSVGIVSVVLLIAFEATAVGTAMPVAARELHGIPLYAFAFSAYFATSLFGMVLAGQWADRAGPLAPLTAGIGMFAAGLLVAGTASGMWVFVLGRGVQGLGGGLVIVALYVVVGRVYPRRLRPSIMAAFAAAWVVPSVVGPLAAGTVTEQLGWRWVFLGIPVLIVLPLALALPAIRRTAAGRADPRAPAPRFDRRRLVPALALSAGATLLQYAGEDLRWVSLVPGVAGAALLGAAVPRLLPAGTWRAARGLPAVVALRGVAAGAFVAAESFVPLMLVTRRGLSPAMAGLSIAVGGATWALGSYVQSRPRLQPRREPLTALGMVLVTLGIAIAPAVLFRAVPVWAVAVAWAVGCLGMGIVVSSTSVVALSLSAPEEVGANSSALQISDGLSNVLMLAVGGAAFGVFGGGAVGAGGAPVAASGAAGSHPAAFASVFVLMAAVALGGVWVATRVRAGGPPGPPRRPGTRGAARM
ncbi:MFS transporter [Streptomyces sp. NPDC047002]|uniref:MFS transporter n=1 Tax=Streptomyces sp. NPDC047002 TaxID=3155475 RepID=UPI003452C38E